MIWKNKHIKELEEENKRLLEELKKSEVRYSTTVSNYETEMRRWSHEVLELQELIDTLESTSALENHKG